MSRLPEGPDLNKRMGFDDADGHRSHDGTWFGPIKKFPAVLWDGPYYGYIRIETEDDLKKYRDYGLNTHPSGEITAPKERGISGLPGYKRVGAAELGLINDDEEPTSRQRRRKILDSSDVPV